MNLVRPTPSSSPDIPQLRARVNGIREQARQRFQSGSGGVPVACFLSESFDELLCELMELAIADWPADQRDLARTSGSLVAVGGTGRGEVAPYSDIDLLFLDRGTPGSEFRDAATKMTQLCWDAGFELGHSVRTTRECLSLAKQEGQIATSLVEARWLWGDQGLVTRMKSAYQSQVVRARLRAFIKCCIAARSEDWGDVRPTALELTPDVKKSLGGLRDLHLIRWMTYALCGQPDLESLRLHGLLPADDIRRLRTAREYLTRIRLNLHFAAGRAQDVLTREDQLRLAVEGEYIGTAAQRPVELFMQEYFRHSSAIAEITRRFISLERRPTLLKRVIDGFATHRSDGVLLIRPQEIDVRDRHLPRITGSIAAMLKLFKSASLYGLLPSPRVIEAIKHAVPKVAAPLSEHEARIFRDILSSPPMLGPVLRQMFDCRLLDYVIPEITHTRCLLQFNQYHSYTVDEHTLRAIETVASFDKDDGPVGSAYRQIQRKDVLHLALLLHDVGKGYEEDHSELGRRIAERVAERLHFSEEQRDQVMLLVQQHLVMADLAMRRDFTDESLLVAFARTVGTPDTLRMLYVLTVADIMAVGPGVFTTWKGDLLADLFDRAMMIVSGKRYSYLEEARMQAVKRHVAESIVPLDGTPDDAAWQRWVDRQLAGFSAYYLTCTSPHRIAADLDIIQHLKPQEIRVEGLFDRLTRSVDYRIIMREDVAQGVFHRITGALTSKRLEIISADINTTADGIVVDSFRVLDRDYSGDVPADRIQEVSDAIRRVLVEDVPIERLFRANRRYGSHLRKGPVADLPLRVVVDNNSSGSRTILDVFAYDRPGLLYVIARALFELNVSVDLAKIGTHFDQVIDVFYVTDAKGAKITDEERLRHIRHTLHARLEEFERDGHPE
ncbi:MAG: [protein-PII] uridylyltransferase [Planctomycetaceae bacterium]|nr:[protein-PII] uridylyltransferase [Planctomycetaceae bacterium]